MERKIKSVTEIAFHRVGDTTWRVALKHNAELPVVPPDDAWMSDHHPKVFFDRKIYNRKIWPYQAPPPKMEAAEFYQLTGLLLHKLVTEQFVICDVTRSNNTGEFFYTNDDGDQMPESYLYDTKAAAEKEKRRILQLVKKWASQ